MAEEYEHVVCIPTFRRPEHLRKTLASLAAQHTQRRFAVVVVDNDADAREGFESACGFMKAGSLPGLVLTESTRGNCAAINCAFAAARREFPNARYFLMIDDDEIADSVWLDAMVDTAERTGADVVGGPVHFNFEDRTSVFCDHPLFQTSYDTSGPVPIIFGSGNCLIARRAFERLDDPSFDMRFNFLGGGDTEFFTRCQRLGMQFHWCQEAVIRETVPRDRTTMRFLVRRGLRTGALNYLIDRKGAAGTTRQLLVIAKNFGALPVGLFRAVHLYAKCWDLRLAVHPILVAAGRSLASIGLEPHQYGS